MKITRLISFVLAAVLLLCSLSACGKKNDKDVSSTRSESDYDWDVPVGDNVDKTEDFDNTGNNTDTPTPTPGQNGGAGSSGVSENGSGSDTNHGGSNSGNGSNQPPAEDTEKPESDFSESFLADNSALQFYFEGDTYAYGIADDNTEYIAFKDCSGKLVDAVSGGGFFILAGQGGRTLVNNYAVEDFTQTISDNEITLIVNYRAQGANADAVKNCTTTYTLYSNSIKVESSINYSGSEAVSGSRSSFQRYLLNDYESSEKNFSTDWNYPDDGDFPYKEIDSWCTVQNFDKNNRMYTFLRSENIPSYYWDYYNRYPEFSIPLFSATEEPTANFSDTVIYSLVFENSSEEKNPDYRALFSGKGMAVATGVEAVTANTENSTVFEGDSVKLNLNVTNLTKEDVMFSYRYDIRDYYGNIVSAGLYLNSTVFGQLEANRIIDFKPGYHGIFFLNLMIVTTDGSHYREYYPFALVEKYDYKYQATSPFGIGQILGGKNEPYLDYLELAGKIGVATIRATPLSLDDIDSSVAYIKKAQEEKIRIFGTGWGDKRYIDTFSSYGINAFTTGNELNLPTINGSATLDEAFDAYYNDYFLAAYENVSKQGYKNILASVSGGQSAWYNKIAEYGGWDKFDAIALHPYGYPYSPDLVPSNNNIWHVEASLQRHNEALARYGYKQTYVTETGYPSVPNDKRAVDLRTQADYNMRCYILSLAYGATDILAYCYTDYSNAGVGVDDTDVEFNFGAFYYPDYFGRIMPKPAAVMFANMTRQLESVKSAEINDKYDDGDGLRVFTLDTALDGDVLVAWSNCARLPNDAFPITRPEREYRRPWENQWHGSQVVTFGTDKATVEVVDTMGNTKTYKAENGSVSIALTGSPVIIKGAY